MANDTVENAESITNFVYKSKYKFHQNILMEDENGMVACGFDEPQCDSNSLCDEVVFYKEQAMISPQTLTFSFEDGSTTNEPLMHWGRTSATTTESGCWYEPVKFSNETSSISINYGNTWGISWKSTGSIEKIQVGHSLNNEWIKLPQTPQQKLKKVIKDRQGPGIIRSLYSDNFHFDRKPLGATKDIREERARQTLRRVLGEEKYKSYLKTGFVYVKGRSGLQYQIFPGHGVTAVYDRGKMVERLCVVLQGDFPPTDSLIMRYLLIANNEQTFRSHANNHRLLEPQRKIEKADNRSLVEIYKEIKEGFIPRVA